MAFRGDRLRQARLAVKDQTKGKKGSQNWLAFQVGAHVTSISDWERGENEPSARYVTKLAEALGVKTDDLLAAEDEPVGRERAMLEVLYEALGAALGKQVA